LCHHFRFCGGGGVKRWHKKFFVKSITAHFGILETNAQQKKFMLSARRDNMLPTVRKLTVKHSNLKRINEKRVATYMVTLFPCLY